MTCPARARGSLTSGGTTAFQSGRRTVNASRFSPIARRPRHLLAVRRRGHRQTSDEARAGRITCAGVVASESRSPFVQHHEGVGHIRCGPSRCRTGRRRPFGDVHSFYPNGGTVLARRTLDRLHEQGTGREDDDLRPAIPSHGKQVPALRQKRVAGFPPPAQNCRLF